MVTVRGVLYILLFLVLAVGIVYGLHMLFVNVFPQNPVVLNSLLSLLVPAILAIGTALFGHLGTWLEDFAQANILRPQKAFRILLFGHPGSGKTTLRKHLMEKGWVGKQKSTKEWTVRKLAIPLDTDDPRAGRVLLMIADYRGQKPQQVICHSDDRFFGPAEHPAVNAVFFVVDVLPAIFREDKQELEEIDDEELMRWLSENDARSALAERVQHNKEYVNGWAIDAIFDIVYSKNSDNLCAVRLLVNKVDLLEEAIEQGYLGEIDAEPKEYARQLYQDIENHLAAYCEKIELKDFEVEVISAKKDIGVREMFGSVLDAYVARRG